MDYLELYRRYGCTLQLGGSDQWGNLVAGVDLIRRVEKASVHALAIPLITKADGTKYGKTEGGAIWISSDLMSPYAFYQFWLNVADAEVPGLLRVYSFKSREEVEELTRQTIERPAARIGQRALAEELATLVHGQEQARQAIAASQAAFGQAEPAQLARSTWAAMTEELPRAPFTWSSFGASDASHGGALSTALNKATAASEPLASGDAASTFSVAGPSIASLMVRAGTAPTLSAARRAIEGGGVYLNNKRVTSVDTELSPDDLYYERYALLRRGRRTVAVVVHVDDKQC
jgi:tyrosyl-tRNA synthetase